MNANTLRQDALTAGFEQYETSWNRTQTNQIRRNEVTIWWANLSEPQLRLSAQSHLLSPDERHRAGRMLSATARDRWVAGRASLRSILAGYLGLRAVAIPITYAALGKPELGSLSPVRFNLSHSAELAAFAIAWRKQVGIDVQRLRDDDLMNDLAPWTFTENDYHAWLTLPIFQRRVSFLRTWVRKEAYLKGRGVGLAYPLRDLTIVKSATAGAIEIVDKHAGDAAQNWRVFDLDAPHPGYVAALAIDGEVSSLVQRGWPDGSVHTIWRPT